MTPSDQSDIRVHRVDTTQKLETYILMAVVVHVGTHHSGHFITYRRSGDRWVRVSDSEVVQVDAAEVFGQKRHVYMLFYERSLH
jgi:ubiquitin C-terminal hydrolase